MSTDVIEDNETWYHCEITAGRRDGVVQHRWPTQMYAGCPPVFRKVFNILSGLEK